MKKILPFLVIGILVLSGLGASAINIEIDGKENNIIGSNERATHTVLGVHGAVAWCEFCKYSHGALKDLYQAGQLDFYYVSLVCDKNDKANASAFNDFNVFGWPTVWWDGGYLVDIGASSIPDAKTRYTTSITQAGSRTVKDADIKLEAIWQGGTKLKVECKVINNEASKYAGTIRVYIVEKVSSMGWLDPAGDLYTMAFLDWAFNQPISISAGGSWSDTITWDGAVNGFPSVTKTNTFIIAAVFNDEWHQGYSWTPPNNPFDAYYPDKVVGTNLKTSKDLQVTPRNRIVNSLLLQFLENHPNMFPLLQKLIQQQWFGL